MLNRPTTLIETWLPIEQIGAESLRDNSAARKPPLNRLHVWWARRPLTVSRAAVVASLLPDYETVAAHPDLRRHFPTRERYEAWFLRLMGIFGDPAAARKLLQVARQRGKPIANPYGYDRAFTFNPEPDDLALLRQLLAAVWGKADLTVLDPFAGGGSIPFEAIRYGFHTIANELNPVAAVILKATLDYPARYGPDLANDIRKWGKRWYELVKPRLQPFFTPLPPDAEGAAYLWARTVACPTTGKPVPLSPNWWLAKGKKPVAVRLRVDPSWDAPRFEIVSGDAIDFDPDEGTISRGVGRSPWTGEAIPGDYIKREAQAGRMGQMLYAVALKRRGGFDFRAPTEEDLAAVARAEAEVARRRSLWEIHDLIPTEPFPDGNDPRPLHYGMNTWADFFAPRQLLALATFVETLRELREELRADMDADRAAAVETYLALAIDKAADYNAILATWETSRQIVKHVFKRHDFAFSWSYGEFDAAGNLLPWSVEQVADAYRGVAKLLTPKAVPLEGKAAALGRATILQGSATHLAALPDGSVDAIITDPPYYENVMYAELSDFFYVWLKRTVGHLYPEWFAAPLTDKDEEAVANPARFAGLGRKKKDLAKQDYEHKMAAAFREMHRILRPDGVLTVMFTHKQVEAWDTLARALIGAGFSIEASWPVHTESEHSLHQAKKNAAQSTILLACRKRTSPLSPQSAAGEGGEVWWEDIAGEVRRVAREKAAEFSAKGIRGVDLYISTFGPVLSVISRHWPVLTSEIDERTGRPKVLRPETALDLAREEAVRLRRQGLVGQDVQFDALTDWYMLAWDIFRAAEFPGDEARKLALTLGLDLERDLVGRRVVSKKGRNVVFLTPQQRRGRGRADPDATQFATLLDALHTAMLIYQEDGGPACEAFLKRTGLRNDGRFKAALQAMLNAIPRVRDKSGKFLRLEAEYLERLRAAFFDDIPRPEEEETQQVTQLSWI